MPLSERIFVSLLFGFVAACFARALSVPWWRDWEIGDASDIGVMTALAVFYLLRTRRS